MRIKFPALVDQIAITISRVPIEKSILIGGVVHAGGALGKLLKDFVQSGEGVFLSGLPYLTSLILGLHIEIKTIVILVVVVHIVVVIS